MKTSRKRGIKRGFISGHGGAFQNKLNFFAREMSQKNNHYAAFLYQQILRDLKELSKKADGNIPESNLISHCLLINKDFKFLPLTFDMEDPVYKREREERSHWIQSREDDESFDVALADHYVQKTSWIIAKILDLSKSFSRWMDEIHKEKKIPVYSLIKIYSVITYGERLLPLLKDGEPSILIPSDIAVEQRDRDLSDISNQIYNLLVECLFVSIVAGMEDSLLVFSYLGRGDFQKAQQYLLNTACYLFMEERIMAACSIDDLKEYFEEELSPFLSFIKHFHNFFEKSVRPLVNLGALLRDRPFKVRTDPSFFQKKVATKEDSDRIQEQAFGVIFDKKTSGGETLEYGENGHSGLAHQPIFAFEEEPSGDEGEEFDDTDLATGYGFDDYSQGYEKEKSDASHHRRKKGEVDYFEPEKKAFLYDVELKQLMEKWQKRLVTTYELRGHPLNLIGYLKVMFNRMGLTVMEEDYNERAKSEGEISLRTKRRYKKGRKEGKIDKSLSEDEIRHQKEDSKKHHVPGYWTLNQLIKELVDRGQGTRTTLMRKINKLLELKKIQFSKEDGIYRFEASEENLDKIAREISRL